MREILLNFRDQKYNHTMVFLMCLHLTDIQLIDKKSY